MRLFVDCRWFSQSGQGVFTYLVGLHEALLARQEAGADDDIMLVLGVEHRDLVPVSLRHPRIEIMEMGRRSFAWRLLVLPFVLRRLKIDLAHFQYSIPLLRLGVRYVVTIHDVLFLTLPQYFSRRYRLVRLPFFRFAAQHAAGVLSVSETSRADIIRLLGTREPVDLVYNGFDTHFRNNTAVPIDTLAGRRFILTIGRVEPRKNYAGLVDAFLGSSVVAEGVELVIVGFCAPEFAGVVAAIAPDPRVHWLDRVGEAELNWLLDEAEAFVFPSFGEGFGIPVLEALARGLPCAISESYPLADVRAACLTFDPADRTAMRSAIAAVVAAPRQPVRTQILQRYSWAASAAAYVATLRRVAAAA